MTHKQKALKAIWKLIVERYEGGKEMINCPLCLLYKGIYNQSEFWMIHCEGCPNYKKNSGLACIRFGTFTDSRLRAIFWRRAMPELEKIPAKYFTPSGWRFEPFAFLEEIDARIMKEHHDTQV